MAYVIAEPCISQKDASCTKVCPVDCDACIAECPVEAIFPDDPVPSVWDGFMQRNADFFAGEAA